LKTVPLLLVRRGDVSDSGISELRQSPRVQLFLAEHLKSSASAFSLRTARATVVATTGDPLAELVYMRTGGFVGPLVLAAKPEHLQMRDALVSADVGVLEMMALPLAADDLDRALNVVEALPAPGLTHESSGLLLDPTDRTARKGGAVVTLSQREFALLHCLLLHPHRPVPIHEILEYVWGSQREPAGAREIVDVNVSQLRKKLDRIGVRGIIRTYRGYGFALADQ
jgi:OmpR family response regulator NblR